MVDPIGTARRVFVRARESELSFLAGSVAFFAFVSIIPAMLLVVAVGTALWSEELATRAVSLIASYLSGEGARVVREALVDSPGGVGASIVGVVGLLWSTLKVFRAIDLAFDRVYGVEKTSPLWRQLVNGAVVVVTIGVGIALLLTVQTVVERLAGDLPAGLVSVPLLVGGLLVALAPLYYVMPPRPVTVREIVPGTVTAVVGLIALRQGFRAYTAVAGEYQAYGVLGAALLFLLWLYFGSLVLLVGAVVNVAVAEGRPGLRDSDRSAASDS